MTDSVTRDSSHQHERGSNKLGLERLRVGVGASWKGSALEGPEVCCSGQAQVPQLAARVCTQALPVPSSTCLVNLLTSLCPIFLIL